MSCLLLFLQLQTFSTYTKSRQLPTKPQTKKYIVLTKPDKGNGVVILDQKLYDNAIQKIILYTSKFEQLDEDPTYKREASRQRFLYKLTKVNIANCILQVLLLLVSMALLKCTNFSLVINFLNFVQLFHLQVLLIVILRTSSEIFFHRYYLMITLAKTLYFFFLKLKMQFFPEKFLFPTMLLGFLLIVRFQKPWIQK